MPLQKNFCVWKKRNSAKTKRNVMYTRIATYWQTLQHFKQVSASRLLNEFLAVSLQRTRSSVKFFLSKAGRIEIAGSRAYDYLNSLCPFASPDTWCSRNSSPLVSILCHAITKVQTTYSTLVLLRPGYILSFT